MPCTADLLRQFGCEGSFEDGERHQHASGFGRQASPSGIQHNAQGTLSSWVVSVSGFEEPISGFDLGSNGSKRQRTYPRSGQFDG